MALILQAARGWEEMATKSLESFSTQTVPGGGGGLDAQSEG